MRTLSGTRYAVVALMTVMLIEAGAVAPAPIMAAEPSPAPVATEEAPAATPTPTPSAEPAPPATPASSPTPRTEPVPDETIAPEPSAVPTDLPAPEPAVDELPEGVEQLDLRTANSRTFEQPDGSFVTELFSGPIHYQPAGTDEWQPIDLVLEPADELAGRGEDVAADVEAVSDDAPAVLSLADGSADDGFIRLAGEGHTISFALPADASAGHASSEPVIEAEGRYAEYADFLSGGIGLRVFPRADGVKAFLVLPERPEQKSFSFVVSAPGLSLDMDEKDGGAVFTDGEGNIVGRIPQPFMVDSSELEGRGGGIYTEAVALSISEQDGQDLLTLTPDQAFLEQAVYPVYLDPTTTNFPNASAGINDTFASSRYPNSNFNTYQRPDSPYHHEMWHGNEPGSSYYNETYIRFNGLADVLGAVHVDQASLTMYPYWQYHHFQARPTWIRQITQTWGVGTLTWNARPTTADNLDPSQFDTTEGQWSDADVTGHIQAVLTGGQTHHGFMLHANDTGQGNWKRFVSEHDASSYKPKLVVQWSPYTVTAANPTGGAETSTRTLSWSNDLGGPQATYEAQLSTNNFSTILATSGQVASADTSWTIPTSTSLTSGTTYQWRVRGKFGANTTWTAFSTASFVHRPTANLGLQAHNSFETWDLGNGDTLAANVASGNVVLSHPIVELPIRGGSSLSLGLTYNSQSTANVGVGPGWQLSAMRRITDLGASGAVFTDADGSVHTFTVAQVNGTVTTYNRPATLYATLVKDTGQALEWKLTYPDQSVDRFDVSGSTGLLTESADRHGNKITFSYSSGTDRLYRATDPAGRYVEFTWDTAASPGRLANFTDWAYVSGGIVQSAATGSRRLYRFFYDTAGQLAGWATPRNTSAVCPPGPHLTCLAYTDGLLTGISKRQTYATLASGVIGTAGRTISATVTYGGNEVVAVRDYLQTSTTETKFTRPAPGQMRVVRDGNTASTTTYGQVGGTTDSLGRIQSVWRRLGTTDIEQRTVWNTTYPTEPASVTDNYGALLNTPARTISYTYVGNSMGLVARQTEPLDGSNDRTTDYTYNANNDLTEMIAALNGSGTTRTITRYCYASSGCATNGTSLTIRAQIYSYVDGAKGGTNGNETDVTTEFLYDQYGQPTRETRYNYDAAGNLLDSRANGYDYDANGSLTKEIVNYSNGTVTSPGDDITPNATTNARTDLTTVHTYDTAGNRISSADPRRAIELAKGSSLAADDYVTRSEYDELNQPVRQYVARDPADSSAPTSSSSGHDELGMIRRSQGLGGLVTASAFDRMSRPVDTFEDPPNVGGTTPAVRTSFTTYDAAGRAATVKDQRQLADSSLGLTRFFYDSLGRQTRTVEAGGTADELHTDSTFDALDRQLTLAHGANVGTGQTTTYRYDVGGRATEQDDGFTCTRTTYDYRDLAVTVIDGLSSGNPCTGTGLRTLTNTYDGMNRLTESKVTAGEGLNDVPGQSTFDAAGNTLSSTSTASGTTTSVGYGINQLDQAIREMRSDNSLSRTNFDAAGNATDRCYWAASPEDTCKPVGSNFTNPPTRLTTTVSDARNQRVELADASTDATTAYDSNHNYQVKAIYVPTGSGKEHQSLYTYDERHRVLTITHHLCTISSGHICSATTGTGSNEYAYDVNDNRSQVIESNGATSSDRRYCYDAQNRLEYRNTSAACSSAAKDESYGYDAAGNRSQSMVGSSTTNFAYNASGQLCHIGATTCGTPNVTYDDAGRTRFWNGWFFSYDAEGRLTKACKDSSCATNAERVEFTYDGEGRRTQIKTALASGSFTTVELRYQGSSVVEERTGSTVTRQYLVDEVGAIVKLIIPTGQANAGSYLATWNGHGDALALHRVNSDGTLTLANSYTYSTWGGSATVTHNSIPDLGFRYLYVGQFGVQSDNPFGLGLLYMQARHYSPAIGRFIQPDPSQLEANHYGYAGNSPVTKVDPDGRLFWFVAIIIVRVAIAAAPVFAAAGRAAPHIQRATLVVQRMGPAAPRIAQTTQSAARALQYRLSIVRAEQLKNAVTIAGKGTPRAIDDVSRIVRENGGQASEWSKMAAKSVYKASNGLNYQGHWYQRRLPNGSIRIADFKWTVHARLQNR